MFTPSSNIAPGKNILKEEKVSVDNIRAIWMKTRHFESFFCGYADLHQSHLRDSDPSTWVQQPRKKALPNPRTEHREAPRPGSENLKKTLQELCDIALKSWMSDLEETCSTAVKR